MEDWNEQGEGVTLPARAFLIENLSEAADCLLTHLVEKLPDAAAGWIVISDNPVSSLRPVASLERLCDVKGNGKVYLRQRDLPKEETGLVYRAFLEQKTLCATAPPLAQDGSSSTVTTLAVPLNARSEKLGILLMRFIGSPPEASVREELEQSAKAVAILLQRLQRDELFQQLELSKQHWEATFDSLQDLLYIHDAQSNLLKVNRAMALRLGLSAWELMLRRDLFSHHFPLECVTEKVTNSRWYSETLDATFEMICTPVYDNASAHIGCVHILRDITDQLRLETQVRQNEKLASLGEMVSGIAHELNNPLASILGFAERLERSRSDTLAMPLKVADSIRKIRQEAARAAYIVQNLLTFARPQPQEKTPVALNMVVRHTAELFAEMLQEERVTLRLQLEENLDRTPGNIYALQQVLSNLITNAVQALRGYRADGQIILTTQALPQGGTRLTVADNGPGILPEHKERLLEPFFTTKNVGEGTGLGLSICYGILCAHDATLDILSEPGQGATFQMDFPTVSASEEPLPPPALAELVALTETDRRESERRAWTVAVVDDEPLLRELLSEMLMDEGFQVTCFSTPAEALARLETDTYDVILSDIKMPDMSGMEFYRAVEAFPPALTPRILFLTGDVLEPATREFFRATDSLFLNKPFKHDALMEQMATLLQRVGHECPARAA